MRSLIALLLLSGACHAGVAKTPWRPVEAKSPWKQAKPQTVAKTPWKASLTPVAGCQNCRPQNTQTQSLPDPLDGSELPDDLFGGTPDPRGGSGGGGGSGNTCFRY